MIISFVQTKGGTSKSTLSLCLAFSVAIRKAFKRIALVELDEQATLQRWWRTRLENRYPTANLSFHHVSSREPHPIQEAMADIVDNHDLLILDVPGESVSRFHTSFACAASDLVLIPMRTSTNDEDAFEANLLPIIDKILERHPEKQEAFYVLPTLTHPLAGKDKLVGYFRNILPGYIQCMDAVFPFRSVYENFNREGLNLYEYTRLVKGNKREYKQAKNAEKDILLISKAILEGAG